MIVIVGRWDRSWTQVGWNSECKKNEDTEKTGQTPETPQIHVIYKTNSVLGTK